MTRRPIYLAGASLLAIGLVPLSAQAQTVDYADECVDLFAFVDDSPTIDLDDEPGIVAVIEDNDARACQLRLTELERTSREGGQDGAQSASGADRQGQAGQTGATAQSRRSDQQSSQSSESSEADQDRSSSQSETQTSRSVQRESQAVSSQQSESETEAEATVMSDTATVQRRVQLEEVVTVQGEVDVVAPVPTVSVRPQPADVDVQADAPRVTVRQGQPEIVVREQPARITVGMPTITIEQDAPEIVITMPRPSVDVASTEPTVEVRQAPPRVRVEVPDPRVNLNLRAETGESDEQVRTRITRERGQSTPEDGLQLSEDSGPNADVYVGEAQPNVRIRGSEAQPDVTVSDAQPTVRFENAEPEVSVEGEPRVDYRRIGEPTVRIEQAGGDNEPSRSQSEPQSRQQAASSGTADRPDREEGDASRDEAGSQNASGRASAGGALTVSDITDREVLGRDGGTIGTIDRVVDYDGQVYVVIEHGGFLGLGAKDVPVLLSELTMVGDDLVANGLTEAQAGEMEESELDGAETLRRNMPISLREQ